MLSPCIRQVTHALLTRPPLIHISLGFNMHPFDLHVLSTPPAFILSQDQTLNKMVSARALIKPGQIVSLSQSLSFKEFLTLSKQASFKAHLTTISFWCFVFVTLFNLQGAHRFVPGDDSVSYHNLNRLSSPFFQVFEVFLRLPFSRLFAPLIQKSF